MVKGKKPWLAALLNIILTGLGYLYIGKRKLFGSLLLTGELLAIIWLFINPSILQLLDNVWVYFISLPWIIGFAIDAYNEAKKQKC